jgi:DNA-directed RNA polymerase sigma subunit (sigma70/sigma32)
MTQNEVAEFFKVHRHEIAKIEADALKKLKRRLEAAGYKKDSFF